MAVTQGHGNPDWTLDETLFALDLYFACQAQVSGPSDPRVRALSDELRSLPVHASAEKKPSFRNPDGVAFKLQILRTVATGKGLKNVSALDRFLWQDFGERPDEVRLIARAIREAAAGVRSPADIEEDEPSFHEGLLLTRAHLVRERSKKLRPALIKDRSESGKVACHCCAWPSAGLNNGAKVEAWQLAALEAHHLIPLVEYRGSSPTKLSDTVLLCANATGRFTLPFGKISAGLG